MLNMQYLDPIHIYQNLMLCQLIHTICILFTHKQLHINGYICNVKHCGGEPELIQEYYVTDEWMSDVKIRNF